MKDNVIYSSSRYGDFGLKTENRLVKIAAANKIAENMKVNGWVGAPIEVSEQNGKLIIEDGQHRFTAAKMVNIPVRFMIVKPRKASDEAELNRLVSKWAMMDYIDMYARNGVHSYKRLMNLINEFPEFSLSEVQTACGISNSKHNELIKQGRIQVSDEKYIKARNILYDLAEVKKAMERIEFDSHQYIKALIALMKADAIEKNRMVEKIDKYGKGIFEKVTTVDKAVDYIERVYNFNAKKEIVYLVDRYKRIKHDSKR